MPVAAACWINEFSNRFFRIAVTVAMVSALFIYAHPLLDYEGWGTLCQAPVLGQGPLRVRCLPGVPRWRDGATAAGDLLIFMPLAALLVSTWGKSRRNAAAEGVLARQWCRSRGPSPNGERPHRHPALPLVLPGCRGQRGLVCLTTSWEKGDCAMRHVCRVQGHPGAWLKRVRLQGTPRAACHDGSLPSARVRDLACVRAAEGTPGFLNGVINLQERAEQAGGHRLQMGAAFLKCLCQPAVVLQQFVSSTLESQGYGTCLM